MNQYWLGLDIGGTKCAVLLATVDRGIRILDKIRFETRTELGFEQTYERLCSEMERILKQNSLTMKHINAIGISCGGPLDSRRGIILCPPNLPGWVNIPLPQMLTERYGVPAYIQNDANACALVEWKLGAGRGTQDMIFLTMGTGMGGGVIAEGQLLRGHTDMGGEIGHLRLSEDGPIGFGKAGSFEGYTSGGGIQRQAMALTEKRIAEGNPPKWIVDGHTVEETDARLMADYARNGDVQAKAFFDEIGRMLGRGIALLVDAFNPECIVIGSIFVRCEDLLRESMMRELQKEAIPFSLQGLRIVPAQTGEALGDLASIMVALYNRQIDPMKASTARDRQVLRCYESLFERYPALDCCRESIMNAYKILLTCYENGHKLLLVGNGGSCSDCEHIAGELMKGFRLKRPLPAETKERIREATETLLPNTADLLQQGLPAIALTGHAALSTAVQNDQDPLLPAVQQMIALGQPGDVLLGISTGGNARNVALTAASAKALGLKTIGLTGADGGRLKVLCDCVIRVPATVTAEIQELHLPVYHTLCSMLEAKLFDE